MSVSQRYYLGAATVIVATVIGTIVAYPHLPTTVPLHWDAQGHTNGWGPKWSLFLYTPSLMAVIALMFILLPWLSPKRFQVRSFQRTYLFILIVIVVLLSYSQLLVLLSGLGVVVDVSRALEGGACLLIVLIGNVMGEVRRSFYLGIRTPWTLASEKVWNATHRFAAKTLVAGGVVGLVGVVIGIAFWLPVTAILISVFVPVIYSLVFYKQLERRGALS